MKKLIKRAFHFLGSVYFAVALIGVTALFVIAGTFLESGTDSHIFASRYTYRHPAFTVLLAFFFVNILFAALRRWPFKARHIPFLITHLGLLMILSGAILKQLYGVQGAMSIMEGSGSHEVYLAETQVLRVEKKDPNRPEERLAKDYSLSGTCRPFNEFEASLTGYAPNCDEQLETWIKGPQAVISGIQPFPVSNLKAGPPRKVRLYPPPHRPWDLHAVSTPNVEQAVHDLFLRNARVTITETQSEKVVYEGSLHEASSSGLDIELQLNFSPVFGFQDPCLMINSETSIPLQGPEALLNKNVKTPYLGHSPLTADLSMTPTLAIIQDFHHDNYLFAFDPQGRLFCRPYRKDNLTSLIVYDEGFGGYAAHAEIPFSAGMGDRRSKEEAIAAIIASELDHAANHNEPLAPPLKLFYQACQSADLPFGETFTRFLQEWDKGNAWIGTPQKPLTPLFSHLFDQISWESVPLRDRKACRWCAHFFQQIDPLLQAGTDPRRVLTQCRWPLPLPPESEERYDTLSYVTRQLFSAGELLPDDEPSGQSLSGMFCAYLRAYGIHWRTVSPPSSTVFPQNASTSIETPVTLKLANSPPLNKLEDNIPRATWKLKKDDQEEILSLPYDRYGSGLRWPALNGEYLFRFQPRFAPIPFHVRLRQARQINYAGSSQPFSYESDLIIVDRRDQSTVETTISMNRVHETWDGYRFYLSNIAPGDETSTKRVQLIVNYDPGKYFLTYPGGALMSLGILLLFWLKRGKTKGDAS